MATPEQNTLLALQLWKPVGDQVSNYFDRRTDLLYKLALLKREEEMQRQQNAFRERLANDQNDRFIQLENMRSQRAEDSAKSAADRQQAALDARETKDLRNAMQHDYEIYAAMAARLKLPAKKLEDFEVSWRGLGELRAETAALKEKADQTTQDAAANAALQALAGMETRRDQLMAGRDALQKPSDEDTKAARSQAVAALRKAIETGKYAGLEAGDKKVKAGLSALSQNNPAEAKLMLGDELVAEYDNAVQSVLANLPNTRSRLQAVANANRDVEAVNRQITELTSDLWKASASNRTLAEKLAQRQTPAAVPQPAAKPPLSYGDNPLLKPKSKGDAVAPVATGPTNSVLRGYEAKTARETGQKNLLALAASRDDARQRETDLSQRLSVAMRPTTLSMPAIGLGSLGNRIPVSESPEASRLAELLRQALAEKQQREAAYQDALRELVLAGRGGPASGRIIAAPAVTLP